MANRKLKNFEYANHSDQGKVHDTNSDVINTFECDNGFGFVVCDGEKINEKGQKAASLAAERIQYYLENEFVEDPSQAVYNAIVYANGFIYEYGRKNAEFKDLGVSCAFVLIRDTKAYYTSVGTSGILFFNGKKLYTLSQGEARASSNVSSDDDLQFIGKEVMLGQVQNIIPKIESQGLVPLNEDMILLCTDGLFNGVSEKAILKVLTDPMPLQTKVYRLIDLANNQKGDDNCSVQMLSFYNLEHDERHFLAIDKKSTSSPDRKKKLASDDDNAESVDSKVSSPFDKISNPYVKYTLILLAVLLVSYMFYDIFIYDPRPAETVVVNNTKVEPTEQLDAEQSADETLEEPSQPSVQLPADRLYTVKRGDTWGKIYRDFAVCSWFIKNHPDNRGKFDSGENPVAGKQITIPLIYSAKQSLNPDFYQEFGTDKTGSRCENANEAFVKTFKTKYGI